MNILTLDVETTIHNKGHWADKRNKLVMVGTKWSGRDNCNILDVIKDGHEETRNYIQHQLNITDILVGFNIKFDLHWLANIGVNFSCIKRVWDAQIAEFLLESQQNPYNSLNDALTKYDYPLKLDVVKTEFWDKGIDTDAIPHEVLTEYLEYDLIGTESVFKEQWFQFTGKRL